MNLITFCNTEVNSDLKGNKIDETLFYEIYNCNYYFYKHMNK